MASSVSFQVDQVQAQSDLAPGTSNDSAEDVLRKFTNPSLVGPGWDALIAAIAAGDQVNWNNALAAFDQLFLSTASGKYLERNAANYGEVKPASVGMSDDVFRALSIIKKNKKLTQEAFLEVLEVFYGPDAVRGLSTSTGAEPFALVDQDTLVLLLDEKVTVTVTFDRTHYTAIASASALEVSGEINRALSEAGTNAYAIAYTDPTARGTFVRIYSGSRGLSSSVRVLGGSAQRWLQFPTPLFDISGFSATTWAVTSPAPGIARFSTSDVGFNLSLVRIGDLVGIYGGATNVFVVAGLAGTFPVTAVDKYYLVSTGSSTVYQYFEIAFTDAPAGTYAQTKFTTVMFFRPTKATLYDQRRHVIVTQLGKVELPSTTNIVRRGAGTGAYVNVQDPIDLVSLVRTPDGIVTGETAAAHGMSVGDQVFIDGALPTGAGPPITSGTPSGDFSGHVATGTTDASLQSTASEMDTVEAVEHLMVRTNEGLLMLVSGKTQTAPGTDAAIANPKVFEITSDTVLGNGGRQLGCKWTDLSTLTQTVGMRRAAASALLDGRVLVTGGTNGDTDVSSAPLAHWDLYTYTNSPAQNTLVSGSMPILRAAHAQCTLTGGLALMSGGWTDGFSQADAAAYSFNPVTNTWTSAGSMRVPRSYHRLVALKDGTALAIGGRTGLGIIQNTVERLTLISTVTFSGSGTNYYLGAGIWQFSASTIVIPVGAAVTIAGSDTPALNGTYTVTAWNNSTKQATMTPVNPSGATELGDHSTFTVTYSNPSWSLVGSMTYMRRDFGVQLLPDGRVVVIGGLGGNATSSSGNETLSSCEIYDPATKLWAPLPPMSVGRVFPIVSYLPTRNAIFVAGGGSPVVEMLDIATMRWSKSLGSLPFATTQPSGGLAASDAFVVVGGIENAHNTTKLSYVVVPGADSVRAGGLNRQATVSAVPSPTEFTYSVADVSSSTPYVETSGATVTPSKALPAPAGVPGPFSYDTKAGLSVTGTVATLGQAINANQSYAAFELDTGSDADPALMFPDEIGYLVFDFGFKGQVGPVKYLGRFDNTALKVDASFRFPASIPAGVTVTLLQSNTPFVPDLHADPLTGNFYLTSSAAGRIAAGAALDDIQAAGLAIERSVVYPSDIGLGNAGDPTSGAQKLSDAAVVWGGDSLEDELATLREGN